jgi:hypothetical protein
LCHLVKKIDAEHIMLFTTKTKIQTMNLIEFENELNELLKVGEIQKAILIAENKLKSFPTTDFHKVLNRDLLKLSPKLIKFINDFYISSINELEGKKGFLSIFHKKGETGKSLKAISCEMNGITINYDLWFINLFAFSFIKEGEDLDWLADYDYYSKKMFIISGFEDIQAVYEDYMKNERWGEENLETLLDLSEIIIILRLQELFKATYEKAKIENYKWTEIPIFINGHDVELNFKTL